MKAMVYHGANDIRLEEKPKPQIIDPTDAVVKIVKTTICGTDLGIWKWPMGAFWGTKASASLKKLARR